MERRCFLSFFSIEKNTNTNNNQRVKREKENQKVVYGRLTCNVSTSCISLTPIVGQNFSMSGKPGDGRTSNMADRFWLSSGVFFIWIHLEEDHYTVTETLFSTLTRQQTRLLEDITSWRTNNIGTLWLDEGRQTFLFLFFFTGDQEENTATILDSKLVKTNKSKRHPFKFGVSKFDKRYGFCASHRQRRNLRISMVL